MNEKVKFLSNGTETYIQKLSRTEQQNSQAIDERETRIYQTKKKPSLFRCSMDTKVEKIPETEPNDTSIRQVGESKEESEEKSNSNEKNSENNRATGDVEMEAEITAEDVEKAGGFGARDDIGSLLPAMIDATDLEESLRDARGFEEEEGGNGEVSRPGIGWIGKDSSDQ